MKLSRPVRVRCDRCRSLLITLTEAPESWNGTFEVQRCDRCFLYRGDFLGQIPAVLASGHDREGQVYIRLMHHVPWEVVRRRLASVRPGKSPVTLQVNDNGETT